MHILTDHLPYEQGITDLIQCLRNYAAGNGPRSESEIAKLEAWAKSGDPARYRNMDYDQGIADALLWLRGKIEQAPEGEDF